MDVRIYDTETIKSFFLFCSFDPSTGELNDFCINQYQNDLYKLIGFLESDQSIYWVGYNNIGFDGQVVEYIYQNYESWIDLTGVEIAQRIWKFAQDCIDRQKYNLFSPYREERLSFKQLDIPRVWHFFNENRRVSLKQAEFELRAETIETFDIEHTKESFTPEEVEALIYYCHNDVKYTYEIYKMTLGDTNHPFYKGKNRIKDREIMEKETGLSCLNWDDVKIGAEWNKVDYKKATRKQDNDLKPRRVNRAFGKKFKEFFPKTISFQTQEVKEFVQDIGDTYVKNEKQEFNITIGENRIQIAKGGIHSQEKGRYFVSDDKYVYIQNDIGSQYPNAMRKYKIYPSHLGIQWNEMLVSKIERRLHYKELWKKTKDPAYGSLQEMGKLSLNGGAYGRLKTKGDWQEDHVAYMKVVVGCQLEILMIIEALTLKGFRVVSVNTDGWDVYIERSRLDEYLEICKGYELKIGNDKLGNFEYTIFDELYQTSVNDYLAIKAINTDKRFTKNEIGRDSPLFYDSLIGGIKAKGDFECDFELHKNSSKRIIPLTIRDYFCKGISPEDFINCHNDIYDFCARSNAGKDFYHIGVQHNKEFNLPKLIRYYASKEGIDIWKMVREECETNARNQRIEAEARHRTVCNNIGDKDAHLKNVDRQYYIDKAREIIFKVENGKPPKKVNNNPNQTSLF